MKESIQADRVVSVVTVIAVVQCRTFPNFSDKRGSSVIFTTVIDHCAQNSNCNKKASTMKQSIQADRVVITLLQFSAGPTLVTKIWYGPALNYSNDSHY